MLSFEAKKIFRVFVWFMTEIIRITSYKQEDHLLGLVWVTILGLVFESFWWYTRKMSECTGRLPEFQECTGGLTDFFYIT